MIRRWLRANAPLAITAVSGIVIAAIVAGLAVVSTGFTAQRVDLSQPSVWVVNPIIPAIGRLNVEIGELDAVVRTNGSDLAIAQDGSRAVLVDQTSAALAIVDPATTELPERVALPPESPSVHLAGDRVVVVENATGELWTTPYDELQSFDFAVDPVLELGADSRIDVDPDGTVIVVSPSAGQVYRVDAATRDDIDARWSVELSEDPSGIDVASLGGGWAVLDRAAGRLIFESSVADLSGLLSDAELQSASLQLGSRRDDRVLLSHRAGLIEVDRSTAAARTLVEGRSGDPVAPMHWDGCAYAAWGDGTAWRSCADDADGGVELALSGFTESDGLRFVANGDRVVLDDGDGEASWAVQSQGERVDGWSDLLATVENEDVPIQNDLDLEPLIELEQLPPVAVDDEFGVRAGRATMLPVLLNDYDPNGDVLVISAVDEIDPRFGRLETIANGQQLQITVPDAVTGRTSFAYEIDDGRGGSASATVTVEVRDDQQNSAPEQVRTSRAEVALGGRVEVNVLGDWVDPDGDPLLLAAANITEPDAVSFTPAGAVVFTPGGSATGTRTVTLVVSDGRSQTTGTLVVDVRDPADVQLTADAFVVQTTVGQEVTVRPLDHVRGGSGAIRLVAVPEKSGSTIVPRLGRGTFTFVSDQVRTHYLEYTVSDGVRSTIGIIRVDVAPAPSGDLAPIATPKSLFIPSLSTRSIDVTATDIDPSGGVLVVTGVTTSANAQLRAQVIEQRIVRISLTAPLEEPAVVNYTISNGIASVTGTITVLEIPRPSQLQPPFASPDSVTVRVGAVVDIPVMDNDSHPDGESIELDPELVTAPPPGAGLLFVSGDRLRYLAPSVAGEFTAVYRILGPDGQTADAEVQISVREPDESSNTPPAPRAVTARVIAGETVRIRIPLAGIDPDGDTVQLLGPDSAPELGTVVAVGPDYFDYQAGDLAAGTDSFRYTVVDSFGAQATAAARVGISPRLDGARNPVAVEDEVTVRPGRSVLVQALANDSDPDGSELTIVSAEPTSPAVTAEVVAGEVVRITTPSEPGTYGVLYTIRNEFGGTSAAFISVTVDESAPLSYPIVSDVVLGVSDVIGRTEVVATVLDRVFFADGDVAELGVEIVPGYGENARLLPDRSIEVTVAEESQIVPFAVSHPDDPDVRALAFVRVPGLRDTLPQRDRRVAAPTVTSETPLLIDINDYVVAFGGDVRLTENGTVRATNSNGDPLVVNSTTLRYVSAARYFGPASISFEVVDSASFGDSSRTATIVIPITVEPAENQPPTFVGAVTEFEPGQSRDIDLVRLTNYPYPDDLAGLRYSIVGSSPDGIEATITGQRLVLTVDPRLPDGARRELALAVSDASGDGVGGRIVVSVVGSTRPLARPVADTATAVRGETTVIDVLGNDQANNPFPDVPLRVVDIRGAGGSAIPDGVEVVPSAANDSVRVVVAEDVPPQEVSFQYRVADATDDPARYVWGNVTVSIQDVPDAVTDVRVTAASDRSLTVAWTAGAFNNSPITGYEVVLTDADSRDTISTTSCATTAGCVISTRGNGPSNAVRISVVAINGQGRSAPRSFGSRVWSDAVPAAPTGVTAAALDQGLRVSWAKPESAGGSAITSYVIRVGDVSRTVEVVETDAVGTVYSEAIRSSSLPNGSSQSVSVSARNATLGEFAAWTEATTTGTPAGPPLALASTVGTASTSTGTTATLSWGGVFSGNGRAVTDHYAAVYVDTAPSCTVRDADSGAPVITPPTGSGVIRLSGSATSATFTGLSPDQRYRLIVFASNGQGCTASTPVEVTPRAVPGTVTAVTISAPAERTPGVAWDYRIDAATADGAPVDNIVYRLSGGSVDGGESGIVPVGTFLTRPNMSHYGNRISVQVKACRSYGELTLCSTDWSAPFEVGVPVMNSALVGLDRSETVPGTDETPGTARWTWSGSPNGSYQSVRYSCDGGVTTLELVDGQGGSCESTGSGPDGSEYADLVITIVANGGNMYERRYPWAG